MLSLWCLPIKKDLPEDAYGMLGHVEVNARKITMPIHSTKASRSAWNWLDQQLKKQLTDDEVQRLTANPRVLDLMVKMMREQTEFKAKELVHGVFTNAKDQIAQMQEWNERCNSFRLTKRQFTDAGARIPKWPQKPSVALVLVPYLPDVQMADGVVKTGITRTFEDLWSLAQFRCYRPSFVSTYIPARFSLPVKLINGVKHPARRSKTVLRWETIDTDGYSGSWPVSDMRVGERASLYPHAGILALLALHTEWFKAHASKSGALPVCLSGYLSDADRPLGITQGGKLGAFAHLYGFEHGKLPGVELEMKGFQEGIVPLYYKEAT